MTKNAKIQRGAGDRSKGHVVTGSVRGQKVGRYTIMGIAPDGTVIYEPKLPPKTVTKAAIRRAVRTVKERHSEDLQAASQS